MNERLTQGDRERSLDAYYLPAGGLDERAERSALLPDRPMNGQMNLFSVIFQLLGENKIKAYEYLDGYEEFDEAI